MSRGAGIFDDVFSALGALPAKLSSITANDATNAIKGIYIPSQEGMARIKRPYQVPGKKVKDSLVDKDPEFYRQAYRYASGDDFAGEGLTRAAVVAGRGLGYVGAMGVGKSILTGGGMFRDGKGNFDIAGVPFI